MTESNPQQSRVDRDTFLHQVVESGLVSAERLDRALKQMPPTDRGRVVARGLVERGILTKFQAERLLVGRTDGFLMGQYRILDEIGRGGMGRVFKAEHMTMGRIVALKILNPDLTKTDRARQLFQREVKAAARLSHPNIVTAFDANQIGERCFLVMEFVDGPNLQDLVKQRGPLPVAQACDYIRQTAIGLQHAHDLGMVHRDIKPANLLVQNTTSKALASSSTIKILDFGLARLKTPEEDSPGQDSDSIETNNTVMGTPDYLSPEQSRNLHSVDGRSDLYSLGCAFYVLLTGRVPFSGGTTIEKLVRQCSEVPKPIQSLRADVPDEVAAIVHQLLAKLPVDRFQSGTELEAALSPFSGRENAAWIAVEPLPVEEIAPVSGRNLPRLPTPPSAEDPWSNIDDDSALHGTLVADAAMSAETQMGSSPRRRAPAKSASPWKWNLLAVLLILTVGVGVLLTLRLLLPKV